MRVRSINAGRLLERHEAMVRFGATSGGGVNRPALSAAESEARAALLQWARARRFSCRIDAIGNLFIGRPGAEPGLAPVRTGSHLDSQMPGGNFDGVYGVLAGFEVLETLEDQGVATRHPLELVVWNNEEGARFSPVTMGSAVHAGDLPLDEALATKDIDGISVQSALDESRVVLGALDAAELSTPSAAYIEAHIEQGPLLEQAGIPVGLVTGIQGITQFTVTLVGSAAHGGTTPMKMRKDAFLAAIELIARIREIAHDEADITRLTFGRLKVLPGTPNTVPAETVFSIDLRHPDRAYLQELAQSIRDFNGKEIAACAVQVEQLLDSPPVAFDNRVRAAVRAALAEHGLPQFELASGATHDAKYMAGLCPTGMIFIPCREGLSHHEDEWAEAEHMIAGANILLAALLELA